VINVVDSAGTSTVTLPNNLVITATGGGNIDATSITESAPGEGSLTGLGSGLVVNGALQWGIPDLGLQFSSPITLNIFVGVNLNGQTLTVMRTVSNGSGWTSDGIVAPATCVVANGFCTFQATKASYYAAASSVPTPVYSGGGGGGYYAPPSPAPSPLPTPISSPTPVPVSVSTSTAGTPSVGQVLGAATFHFNRNLSIGTKNSDVTELQKRLAQEGLYAGAINGVFNNATLKAVKAYQSGNGIPSTGFVGPLTRGKLNSAIVNVSGLVRAQGDYKVYQIDSNMTKHWLNMTAEVFVNSGRKWDAVRMISPSQRDSYNTGTDMLN